MNKSFALVLLFASAAIAQTSQPSCDEGFNLYGYTASVYPLPPGPHLFIDYRYIDAGQTRYEFPDGKEAPRYGGDVSKIDTIVAVPQQSASNIRVEAQKAEKLGPILASDQPWEFMVGYPTLLRDQDKFRMWYAVAADDGDRAGEAVCYAESDDGLKWTKPNLGLIEAGGTKANNVVYTPAFAKQQTVHGIGVFIDPIASPEQRYKLVYMSRGSDAEIQAFKAKYPLSVSPAGERKSTFIRLASSPDGIRFTPMPTPLMVHQSDTLTTIYYDQTLKRYVGFFRVYIMDRRAIARSESRDINSSWPIPKPVLVPGPLHDGASEDFYISGYCRYPGTTTMHLMIPTIFKRHADNTSFALASSLTGEHWDFLSGPRILEPGQHGDWDGGCIFAGINLTELPDGRVVFPYDGYVYPHKYPRWGDHMGKIGLAGWKKERLAAVIADEVGQFTTRPLTSQGTKLLLNFQTKRDGYVKVSIEGKDNAPIASRTVALCDPLFGDEIKKQVTWKGESDIAIKPGESFILHFELREARLYSFELR